MRDQLSKIVAIAIRAGALINALRRDLDGWDHKADGSPVTAADRGAEDVIVDGLLRLDPGAIIIAEERMSSGETKPVAPARFYLVDPLDGTKEFVRGRDEFTVNIGLIEDGAPVLGVVIAPALDEGFAADVSGAYAFRVDDDRAVDVRPIRARRPGPRLTVVTSKSHMTPQTDAYLERFDVAERISYGSSLKFCRLAEGIADLYPRVGRTMEWDTAAADAILRRAGGSVRTFDGRTLTYGKVNTPGEAAFANPNFVAFGDWSAERLAEA
jgi:3'(2'), 5'-bisphosphate nucleotidase